MDTQPTGAVANDANAPVEATNPADVFKQLAEEEFGVTDEQEEQPAEEDQPLDEAEDETEAEAEADDLPPIEAPVSWDADAKEKFAQLPRELQETVSKRESERERFVQSKSQEAARARQETEQAALSQLATIERQYAQQFQEAATRLQPQRPDPALLQTDPMAFYARQAQYESHVAQQHQLQQQAQAYEAQAQQREQAAMQAYHAEQSRIITENFPEYADPTTGPKLQAELSAVARELGYPPELIAEARAQDILAMRRVADLKAKADKYDALNKSKMANVRAARGLPRVATPGVTVGTDQSRANRATAALETAKSTKNRDVQGAAFFDYLKNTGQI